MELAKLIKTKSKGQLGSGQALDILFAASEVAPFSKTGGLADVGASLPKALVDLGHRVSVITPLYRHLDPHKMKLSRRLTPLMVPRLGKFRNKVEATVWETRVEGGVRVFFVESDEFFDRDGLYGYGGDDFEDNAARFSFFSRAVVEFALQYAVPVDIIHLNDWHTALAAVFKDHYYEEELADVATVLTLHNLAFQGRFDAEALSQTGLPKKFNKDSELKDGDQINFLKGGLNHADRITTVSPTYADEIRTAEHGCGLEDLLEDLSERLEGILNGADYSVWSPDIDRFIDIPYDVESLNGKRRNKAELQHHFGLPIRPTLPLVGFIGRLTEQKGLDILLPAIESLLDGYESEREGFQFVLLGEGDDAYAKKVRDLAERFPRRIGVHLGYSDEMAHRIQASSDLLAIPSRYEPCGLIQLYAMRYGTLPIVHATGGLVDTVNDPGDDGLEQGTGFVFDDYSADALEATIDRAVSRYRNYRKWRPMMENAMRQDFSWKTSAERYAELYRDARQEIEGSTHEQHA